MKKPPVIVSFLFAALLAGGILFRPVTAHAQACEQASTAEDNLEDFLDDEEEALNHFVTEIENFSSDKLQIADDESGDDRSMAKREMLERIKDFDVNVRTALSRWWKELEAALHPMVQELNVAKIDQTRQIGSLMDGVMINEVVLAKKKQELESFRRYMPSEASCQLDTMGAGANRAAQASIGYARGMGVSDTERRTNSRAGTDAAAAKGTAAVQRQDWVEYTTYFCDPRHGDQGCQNPGLLAGRHTDIGSLLWGDRQTIDMNNADNRRVVGAVQRYLISPTVPDSIPLQALNTDPGREAYMARRARQGRMNAIYNVTGMMLGERASGSGINTQPMRTLAGVPPVDTSADASYREIQQTMMKDRFRNPEYISAVISHPEQVVREQNSLSALRMQQLSDIFHRMEEMIFMEAAVYGADLDRAPVRTK